VGRTRRARIKAKAKAKAKPIVAPVAPITKDDFMATGDFWRLLRGMWTWRSCFTRFGW